MSERRLYFLGIGGIGMSALARYFMHEGCAVAGYDRTATPLTARLEAEGAQIHFEDSVAAIPQQFLERDTIVV
ncbi:MAG: Mur ligase domain-containing protein, partial [Alistipes sp.]|nr:Mur ligase domain-containing protein [Alistipes sp.]